MLESLFEWLFKFKFSNYFPDGKIVFQAGRAFYPFLSLIFLLLIAFAVIYFIANIYTTTRSKAISITLRVLALLVLCLPLLEPMLIMPDIVPNENFLAVLIDDSASMTISDGYYSETRHGGTHSAMWCRGSTVLNTLQMKDEVQTSQLHSSGLSPISKVSPLPG